MAASVNGDVLKAYFYRIVTTSSVFRRHLENVLPSSHIKTDRRRCYTSKSFSSTVLTPRTAFPQNITGPKRLVRDKEITKCACFEGHYSWQFENNNGAEYILHDGPPYANGKTHLGHAVNKILKDVTIRFKSLSGHRVHYVPGWDCHGLPIELKALTEPADRHLSTDVKYVRSKARKFAEETVKEQMKSFQHWGIMADWSQIYRTFDPKYVAQQLNAFYTLYEKGLVFQDYKPVHWSPSNKTALAEAELEYNEEHESPSVFIKFPLKNVPEVVKSVLGSNCKVFALIWTTTPWTIPANQAICFAPNKIYCAAKRRDNDEVFLVAVEMLPQIQHSLNEEFQTLTTFEGMLLKTMSYLHPLNDSLELQFYPGSHVTMTKGTGLVHSAPNHGFEDFQCAQEQGLMANECIVDERGHFTSKAGDLLAGKEVLGEGSSLVLKMLGELVAHSGTLTHSYPYDWRSKQPIIIRSSRQWFINLDPVREPAVDCLKSVKMWPEGAKNMLVTQLQKRPHWCISRQRCWGVPIPVVYLKPDLTPVISSSLVKNLSRLFEEHGCDIWWNGSKKDLFPEEFLKENKIRSREEFEPGQDIMDIWLDSGLSWYSVLPESKKADMYMEGMDQIRGWFQSSLITSVALQGHAPYRSVFMHGFTLDSEGKKMSKSLGNVIDPELITNGGEDQRKDPIYGVDVLRWWVASHASHYDNVMVGKHVIKESFDHVSKLRNTFRFLLGSLHEFRLNEHGCELSEMLPLDQYMLHSLYKFQKTVVTCYENLHYSQACQHILNFVINDISSFYFHAIKDKLYCDSKTSISRRSCQTVLCHMLDILGFCVAPVLPHLMEEVFSYHPAENRAKEGVFRRCWKKAPEAWLRKDLEEAAKVVLEVKNVINKAVSKANPRQLNAIVCAPSELLRDLQVFQAEENSNCSSLSDVWQVSLVTLLEEEPSELPEKSTVYSLPYDELFKVILHPASQAYCQRCRRYTAAPENKICARCEKVIDSVKACKHLQ